MLRLIQFCLVLFLVSCSGASKQNGAVSSQPSASSSTSAPTTSVESSAEMELPKKVYFSDLQILIETKPVGECPESQKLLDGRSEDWSVEIDSEGQLIKKLGPKSVQYYALNLQIQKLGFDVAQYQFSVRDGVVPEWAPHSLRIRRRPGNFIELYYLKDVFVLQLAQTQVYSFKAEEKRGSCTIQHDINIFAENSGFYPTP